MEISHTFPRATNTRSACPTHSPRSTSPHHPSLYLPPPHSTLPIMLSRVASRVGGGVTNRLCSSRISVSGRLDGAGAGGVRSTSTRLLAIRLYSSKKVSPKTHHPLHYDIPTSLSLIIRIIGVPPCDDSSKSTSKTRPRYCIYFFSSIIFPSHTPILLIPSHVTCQPYFPQTSRETSPTLTQFHFFSLAS